MHNLPWPVDPEKFFLQKEAQVYFRYPYSDRIQLWSGDNSSQGESSEKGKARFYFAPFLIRAEQELYFSVIHKDHWKQDDFIQQVKASVQGGASEYQITKGAENDTGEKQRYLRLLHNALQELHEGTLKKVVLSRPALLEHQAHPLQLFARAVDRYPGAFCYLYFHPEQGCWLGASPEILIQKEGDKVETYSLAGTRKKNGELPPNWSPKEEEEQRIVTEFLEERLSPVVEDLIQEGPHDHAAGSLWHLRTVLRGDSQTKAIPLVRLLHPSPAVCGMPKDQAQRYILQHEGYERSYYTGFLGPVQEDVASVFVNLRCMQLRQNQAILYVGGGVTKDSVPEHEWEETCHKLQTMQQLFAE